MARDALFPAPSPVEEGFLALGTIQEEPCTTDHDRADLHRGWAAAVLQPVPGASTEWTASTIPTSPPGSSIGEPGQELEQREWKERCRESD